MPAPDSARSYGTVVRTFFAGAEVVRSAIADPTVVAAWSRPSVLEGQLVGGLAGHLARGGAWVVTELLDAGPTQAPVTLHTAAAYVATVVSEAPPSTHQVNRDRGAEIGAVGPATLASQLDERLADLRDRLPGLDPATPVEVVGGHVVALEPFLLTRLVEQVVHLDDLARSVQREPWAYPADGYDTVLAIGMDVARAKSGPDALLRALYRKGFVDGVLPVL